MITKSFPRSLIFGLTSVCIWSTVATAFKLVLGHMQVSQLVFLAALTSVFVLTFIIIFTKRFNIIRSIRGRDWLFAGLMGGLNPFLYYTILLEAYDRLPAQEAQALNYTWAITLSVLSVPLLGQRMGLRDVVSILIGYSGVLIIATHGDVFSLDFSDTTGVLLALSTTLIWAVYWILNTKNHIDSLVFLWMSFVAALPMTFIYMLSTDGLFTLSPGAVCGGLYIGVFEMGITFWLWGLALKHSSSVSRTSTLIFLSPVISLFFIYTFLDEPILSSTISGLILILTGSLMQQFCTPKKMPADTGVSAPDEN